MNLKQIFIVCTLFINLHAADTNPTTLEMSKGVYNTEENIVLTFSNMLGDSDDWIAIYEEGSSTAWENVLRWDWTEGVTDGNFTFDALEEGAYEARAFFEDSYTLEARATFKVTNPELAVELTSSKENYLTTEEIVINFKNMSGHSEDWIAIYPQESSTIWQNVIEWKFTEGDTDGSLTFNPLEIGNYEARAFFENSFNLEKSIAFVVEDVNPQPTVVLHTSKTKYLVDENISVGFENMLGDIEDWIAIYPKESSTAWKNVIEWKFTGGLIDGNITFSPLPIGVYEARSFFDNSFKLEQSKAFEVIETPAFTLYEDAENNLSSEWIHFSGNYAPLRVEGGFNSTGSLALTTEWTNNGTLNLAEYFLPLHNTTQKILEMDVGGVANYLLPNKLAGHEGYMSHFAIGVIIHTTDGKRKMLWDSFLNHGNVEAYRTDNGNGNVWLYYPSPVEHVRGFLNVDVNQWDHFRVDIESELKKLEPDNDVTSIDFLLLTGGFLDNIKLSTK